MPRPGLVIALFGLSIIPGHLSGQLPFTGCLDRHYRPIVGVMDNSIAAAAQAT